MKFKLGVLSLLSLFCCQQAFSIYISPLQVLNTDEIKQLKTDGHLMKTEPIADGPWPLVSIWIVINAQTITSAAIYYALDHQKEYVPGMLKSTPITQISPTEIHTEYEFKMPWPLKNSKYVNGTRLVSSASEVFEIYWYQVTNPDAKSVDGAAIFTPWEGGKTLLYYRNKVIPKGMLAGLLKNMAARDMYSTVKAIAQYIEKLNRENSPLIQKYESYIFRSFKGEYVYLPAKADSAK